jgi:menaquinone-9 beta-reductase
MGFSVAGDHPQGAGVSALDFDVVVAGAGIAGCTAAATLARRGHSVLLLEADRYPTHKMCGEFLSPESTRLLRDLGVEDDVRARGAVAIRNVAITAPSGLAWRAPLPRAGIGISRWSLDPLLFGAATAHGATGLQQARVTAIEGDAREGFRVAFAVEGEAREVSARLVIGAYGKRSRMDRALGRTFGRGAHDFVAFKAHHRGLDLGDFVELHAFAGGYCGMSHVESGLVNVCLIARTDVLRASGKSFESMRDGVMRENPVLASRFDRLRLAVSHVVATSQIPFVEKEPVSRGVLMVGDTAGMIAPLCGDGMAMALRSAEIASGLADRYLRGETTFDELADGYTRAWRGAFSTRLGLGRLLQRGLFRPLAARVGLATLNAVPWLGRALVAATRDTQYTER